MEDGIGYHEIQVDEDSFEITFIGNQRNTRDEVKKYLTYRCAELTIEKGFTHFLIDEDLSLEGGESQIASESELSVRMQRSALTGVNVVVSDNFNEQSTGSNIVCIYLISMRQGPHPVHKSASIDALAFMESNQKLVK